MSPLTLGPTLGVALWGGRETFKGQRLAGGSISPEVYSPIPFPVSLPLSLLCFIFAIEGVICGALSTSCSNSLLPCHPHHESLPLRNPNPKYSFFQKSFQLHGLLLQHKVTKTDAFKWDVPIRKHSKGKERKTFSTHHFVSTSFSVGITLLTCIPLNSTQCKQRGKRNAFPL